MDELESILNDLKTIYEVVGRLENKEFFDVYFKERMSQDVILEYFRKLRSF